LGCDEKLQKGESKSKVEGTVEMTFLRASNQSVGNNRRLSGDKDEKIRRKYCSMNGGNFEK